MVSRTDVAAFGIKLNEAVGEEGVGGEAVAKDKSVDEFASKVGFLVNARLQEVCQVGGGLAFHAYIKMLSTVRVFKK